MNHLANGKIQVVYHNSDGETTLEWNATMDNTVTVNGVAYTVGAAQSINHGSWTIHERQVLGAWAVMRNGSQIFEINYQTAALTVIYYGSNSMYYTVVPNRYADTNQLKTAMGTPAAGWDPAPGGKIWEYPIDFTVDTGWKMQSYDYILMFHVKQLEGDGEGNGHIYLYTPIAG